MSNFSQVYQVYLVGFCGVDEGAGMPCSERLCQALALGVYHRTTSKPPLMSSVAVMAELRQLSDCKMQAPTAPSKPLKGCCILHRVGDNKIAAIKAAREVTSLGLKEAKDLIDACTGESIYQNSIRVGYTGGRSTVIVANDLAKAEQTATLLRAVGCTVEVS